MSDRIAVIGSNSFSGSSFVRHCLVQGIEVLGASRSEEPAACFLPYRWLPPAQQKGFRFVRADLNRDLDGLMDALNAFRPSWVVNFAAQGMVAQSWLQPEHWYQTNVVETCSFTTGFAKSDGSKNTCTSARQRSMAVQRVSSMKVRLSIPVRPTLPLAQHAISISELSLTSIVSLLPGPVRPTFTDPGSNSTGSFPARSFQ